MTRSRSGFTYIEVLIALAVLAVLFVPMMRLFTAGLSSVAVSGDLITAGNLGRTAMERVRNLTLTKAQLSTLGDDWMPPVTEPPLRMNGSDWRVLTRYQSGTDPLEVDVLVYLAQDLKKPVVSLSTLIEDDIWTE